MNDDQTLELPVRSISPSDIKRYLYHHGWKELPHPRNGLMVFEGPRDDDGEPIIQVIPQSSQSADFAMRARELVNALGIIEGRRPAEVFSEIVGRGNSSPSGPEPRPEHWWSTFFFRPLPRPVTAALVLFISTALFMSSVMSSAILVYVAQMLETERTKIETSQETSKKLSEELEEKIGALKTQIVNLQSSLDTTSKAMTHIDDPEKNLPDNLKTPKLQNQ